MKSKYIFMNLMIGMVLTIGNAYADGKITIKNQDIDTKKMDCALYPSTPTTQLSEHGGIYHISAIPIPEIGKDLNDTVRIGQYNMMLSCQIVGTGKQAQSRCNTTPFTVTDQDHLQVKLSVDPNDPNKVICVLTK